jgi:ribosomal protein S18 acetylase RimI-like enzyme
MVTPIALHPPDSRIHIRPVRLADALLLQRRCWPERSLDSVQQLITRAQRMARNHYGLGVVVVVEDGVIGYGQLALWPRCAEISDLIVCEAYRGQGIGTTLIQYLMRAAREMQASNVEIGAALANERALALYRRLGFREERVIRLHLDGSEVAVQYLCLLLDAAADGGQRS